MQVDVWFDVVCPWCYLGKRRLENALAQFEHADEVEVVWRSYQLEPSFPAGARKPVHDYLADKFRTTADRAREMTDHVKGLAEQEGLAFDAARGWMVNTFDAHRLAHLARRYGRSGRMEERLLRAHHIEGEILDDPETLVRLGAEVGVPAEEVRRLLAGDAYTPEVRDDIRQAAELGVTSVPCFVLDGGYVVSGAQPAEAFLFALRTAYEREPAGSSGKTAGG